MFFLVLIPAFWIGCVDSMKASELFQIIEQEIPLKLAMKGDIVGYIGTIDPAIFYVQNILVLMDYISPSPLENEYYNQFDLLILHHPPITIPLIPTYVIHSNWDIIQGGACDALADCLHIVPESLLDDENKLGRIGQILNGPVSLERFIRELQKKLRIMDIRIVNYNNLKMIKKVALVSGFGLNSKLIQIAIEKKVDVFVSGDMTHPGAILAKAAGLTLIDATHYATEFPGLCRLGNFIATLGPNVIVRNEALPWQNIMNTLSV